MSDDFDWIEENESAYRKGRMLGALALCWFTMLIGGCAFVIWRLWP